jgi:membrane protein required for colicin V production
MHWVDIAIISIIVLSMITGLFRGFVKELIALCVWILAFWLAFHYASMLDGWVNPYIHDNTLKIIVEFIIIFFATLIVGAIVNACIGFIMRRSGLSGTDRVLGMGFGFVRGLFLIAIIMVGFRISNMPYSEYSKDSSLYAKFDPLVSWLSGYVPDFINQVKVLDKPKEPKS